MKNKKKSPAPKQKKSEIKTQARKPAKKKIFAAVKPEVMDEDSDRNSKYQYPGETHSDEQLVNPSLRMRRRPSLRPNQRSPLHK